VRKRSCLGRLLALCVGSVAALALAEVATRMLGLGVPERGAQASTEAITQPLDSNQGLTWMLRPNSEVVAHYPGHGSLPARDVQYRINEFGLRDRAFELHKAPGALRLVVLGDSFVFGTGVALDETLPKALERSLARLAPELAIEVLNAGVFNYNALQEAAFLEARVADLEPDLVLICFYINDASGAGVPPPAEPPPEAWETACIRHLGLTSGVWAKGEENQLSRRVAMALRRNSELADLACFRLYNWLHGRVAVANYRADWQLTSPGFNCVRRALRDCVETARARGFELHATMYPDLAGLDSTYPHLDAHALLQRVCAAMQVSYHDALPALSGKRPSTLWAHPHDHHPSGACHELVAETLARELLPALRARAAAVTTR
jgi:lysophospholipase L1-like esterase